MDIKTISFFEKLEEYSSYLNFFGCILILIGLILGGIFTYRASKQQNRNKTKERRISNQLILCGVFITAIGTLLSAGASLFASSQQNKDQKKLNDKISELLFAQSQAKIEIKTKTDTIIFLYKSLSELQGELQKKTQQIAKITEETAFYTTGGNSFCYITFKQTLGDTNANSIKFYLKQRGKYPIYNLRLVISDVNKMSFYEAMPISQEHRILAAIKDNALKQYDIGDVRKWTGGISTFVLPKSGNQNFIISIDQRNGLFTQILSLRRVNKSWKMATKILSVDYKLKKEYKDYKPLYQVIDKDFPRQKNGKVDAPYW